MQMYRSYAIQVRKLYLIKDIGPTTYIYFNLSTIY